MSDRAPVWECYRLPGISQPDEWRELLERCLDRAECPYRYDIRNTSLRVWHPDAPEIKVPNSDYTCRNGYKLQRVTFGRSQAETWVGITLTRLVFESGAKFPSFFSTDELFSKGKYPAVLRHQSMIAGIEQLIECLNASLVGTQLQRHSHYAVANHASHISYHFGNRSYSLAQAIQHPGLSKNLLNAVKSSQALVPASVKLGILSSSVRNSGKALEIGKLVRGVLQDWHCCASFEDLKDRDEIEAFLADLSQGQPIVLVPLEGKKGDRPPDAILNQLKFLHSQKAAFQLCSVASNPFYSRHGLAIAILAKANGSIFRVEPDGFPNFRRSWFIGLDLGRGGLNRGRVVAIALTNPEGNLQAYWRAVKNEDEALSADVLRDGLSWIVSEAESLAMGRSFYIIRDGRRPSKELLEFYHNALGDREFTLIEYIKSGSPLIHCASFEPQPGTAILPEESDFATLYPCSSPQSGVLTTAVKFCVSINPNGHSLSEIAGLLTALCHCATLSYQPSRFPAPLQWANGLTRLSYTDLQFSGWSHIASQRVDL
jgi:hypothetical protein